MPKVSNFKVIIEQDEKNYFVAWVPAIPGCYSQGKTYEEVLKNIKEAIELCLEVANDNPEYRTKIDFGSLNKFSKFLGVTDIPIRLQFN